MSATVRSITAVGSPKPDTKSATVRLKRVVAMRVPVAAGIASPMRAIVLVADIVPVADIAVVADIAAAADIAAVADIAAAGAEVEDAAADVVRTSASSKTSRRWRGSTTVSSSIASATRGAIAQSMLA